MSRPSHPFSVSHRDIYRIAIPASFAFMTEPLVGIVDIAVIGRLGDAGLLGGLELGAVTFSLVFAMAFFLRLGTAGLTAQSVGAKEDDQGFIHLLRAGLLGIIIGGSLLLLSPVVQYIGLVLFAPPSQGVRDPYLEYLAVRMWSAPFVLLNYALLGWFYGRGAARIGMMLQIGINVINMGLSIWFVYGLNWGVSGVAAATVFAEASIVLISLLAVLRQLRLSRNIFENISIERIFSRKALKRLLDLSRDLMVRSLVLSLAFAGFSAQMSRQGELTLASSAVLLNFMMVTAFFLDGQAQAAEFYCGKAVGANYRPAFEQGWRLATIGGLIIGFTLFVFWWLAGPFLIDLITTNAQVQTQARAYLFVASLIAFTGVIAFVIDGVMIGATLNDIMRNGMAKSFLVYIIAMFLLEKLFGLTGLWLSLHVFFIARGAFYWLAVKKQYHTLFD